MPSDAINTLQLKITNDASDALKEVDKLINGVDKLKKKVSEKTEPKGLEETKKTLKEIGSKVEELTIKAGYLEKLGKGGSLNKEAQAEKARANYALQYLSTMEKIKKIQDDIAKKAEQTANAEKLKAEAPGRRAAMDAADKSTLLNWKYGYLSDKANAELEKGNLSKANDIALQMLQVQERITKEGVRAAEAEKKARAEQVQRAYGIGNTVGNAVAHPLASLKKLGSNIFGSFTDKSGALSALKGFASPIVTSLKSIGKAALQHITEPFKKAHKAVSKFFSSIARIAFYRLIRSALRELTQGFSEGVKNLYAWSEAFGTKFAPVMDQFKTQMTYLKNGFASMFSPLIEWVVPNVIVPLTDALVELFNYIQQAFAILVGHDYWYKAQKSMQKFGEATKKANIQLAKFDELNNLTESDNGSDSDASGMFTLEKVAVNASFDLFKTLREEIKKGDWYGVGKLIAEGLNKGVESIDAKGVANGISKVINDAFNFLNGFASTLNWENIGNKVGTFLDTVFKTVKWKNMGDAIGKVAGGFLTLILGAIEKIDIANAVKAFFSFWEGLFGGVRNKLFEDDGYHIKMFGLKLAEFVISVVHYGLQAFRKFLSGGNVFDGLSGRFYARQIGLDPDEFDTFKETTSDLAFQAFLKPIKDSQAALEQSHKEWLENIEEENRRSAELTGKIATDLGVKVQGEGQKTTKYITDKTKGLEKPIDSTTKHIKDKFGDVTASAKKILDGVDLTKKVKPLATQLSTGLKTGVEEGKSSVQKKIIESFNVSLYENGKSAGESYINGVSSVISSYGISSSSGGGTTRFAMIKDAMGGFMKFANGGLTSSLSQGTMYVAGEVPGQAEMVGNINGRTGVASGYEITGIRDAIIASGENEDRLLTRLISALERKQLVIAPSAQLGRVMAQSSRMYGAVTG